MAKSAKELSEKWAMDWLVSIDAADAVSVAR